VRRASASVGWLPAGGRRAAAAGLLLVLLGPLVQVAAVVLRPESAVVDAARLATVAAAAGLCALRAALVRTDRVAWTLLAAGLLCWTATPVRWLLDGPRTVLLPDVLDGVPLVFLLVAVPALALLIRVRAAGPPVRGLVADAVVALLAAGAAAAAVAGPRLGATGGGLPGVLVLAYVVLDVMVAGHLVMLVSASGFREPGLWLLTAGFGLYLLTDAAYTIAAAHGSYAIGDAAGLGWSTGIALVGVAACARPLAVRQLRLRPATVLALPMLSVAVALAVLGWAGYADAPAGAVPLALAAVGIASVRASLVLRRSLLVTAAARDAVTDELTGLANRRLLLARLDAALAGADPAPHALVLLDLNSFKEINDTLGHPVGDELLRRLGPRLAGTAQQGETVARLGGDEFAVLLPGIATEEAGRKAAERVLAGLLGAFVIDGLTLFVTASAGVALAPRHGSDGATLLRCADVAMYQAKRADGGAAVYRPLADPHSRSRLGAVTELKRAIADGDIVCHYQPQVDVASGVPVGAEALARWSDPRRGLVPPVEFFGLAQHSGLLPALSDAVLRTALADVRHWREEAPQLRVTVNLASGSLLDSRLPVRVAAALAAAGLPADALALDVADGALADAGRARTVVGRLHDLGVRVALDDYGTGRSSVVLLRQLPVDELKLDGGLVDAVVEDPRARAIVAHTVLMAHALGITVVAKGVEDAATLAVVETLGCDSAQGFLLAAPMPAADLTGWLRVRGSRVAHSAADRLAT
jgi:diguanylate cyclase